MQSLPLWERGLKCVSHTVNMQDYIVAPLVGAWIEIAYNRCVSTLERVAPLVGAWIEIGEGIAIPHAKTSLPLWERGLKSFCQSLT